MKLSTQASAQLTLDIDERIHFVTLLIDGVPVLKIAELSDDETINLFLTPLSGSVITESLDKQAGQDSFDWTHELLCNRPTDVG